MDHGTEHDEHGGGVHLPDPSVWPLIVGVAALLLGIMLVWWSRTDDKSVSGPLLGAAIVVTLFSAAGWAFEDARMRKKAEEGDTKLKAVKFTQVMTFAIAPGQADSARSGVLAALDAAEHNIRKHAGFSDLRVTVSPATSGPLQAIVETTWSDKGGPEGYDASRAELESVVAAHATQVVDGSVRTFDMEVIRDTKETAMKISRGATIGLVGAFVVGGFLVGTMLTFFQHVGEPVAAVAEAPADPNAPPTVVGTDNKFSTTSLTATAGQPFSVTFRNNGRTKHNLHFYTAAGGQTLADGAEGDIIDGGEQYVLTFTPPNAGSFYFQCDLHIDQMNGTLTVQ